MRIRNFSGNFAAVLAAGLFGASVVATPLFTFIYQSLLPMELRARGQVQFGE